MASIAGAAAQYLFAAAHRTGFLSVHVLVGSSATRLPPCFDRRGLAENGVSAPKPSTRALRSLFSLAAHTFLTSMPCIVCLGAVLKASWHRLFVGMIILVSSNPKLWGLGPISPRSYFGFADNHINGTSTCG